MLLPAQRDAIVLPVHASLMSIEMGGGNITNRHTIAAFLNIISLLSKRMQSAPETSGIVERGMYALVASDRRWMATDKWVFSGPEMLDIRSAVSAGDMLIKRANSTMIAAVINRVHALNSITPEVLGTVKEPLGVEA
ncbi:MAG: hypothetical protein WAO76_00310 [Georgfuchsia sp.]